MPNKNTTPVTSDNPLCPRCGERPVRRVLPDGAAVPGALSRRDNRTEVCSQCGFDEAMEDLVVGQPKRAWAIDLADTLKTAPDGTDA